MKRIRVIGIGAGDPEYLTVQAIAALNEADVIFLIDKGTEKQDLARIRRDICERYIRNPSYRLVEIRDPVRARTSPSYEAEVAAWRKKRAAAYRASIGEALRDGECGAFLAWGDPSLYDGTVDILQQILADAPGTFVYDVIPGISSVQALAARHKIALNRVGRALQITTGRRLAAGFPDDIDDLVVLLDAEGAFRTLAEADVEIYWGAYLGTPDEVLLSGKLGELADQIEQIRARKKAEKGWIMDTYLLRRNPPDS